MRLPWTRAELDAVLPRLEAKIAVTETEQPAARPLLPMTCAECRDYFNRLMDAAAVRPLTLDECFLHGQLLACFEHAVRAETLGKKGRYFVVSEDEISRLMKDDTS